MAKLLITTILFLMTSILSGQSITTQAFTVQGDIDKFYPVAFHDASWYYGATEIELTRSDTHEDSMWRGSLVAKFRYHITGWGNGSNFITTDIRCSTPFIADFVDATSAAPTMEIIIWLRGGGTTYHVRSLNSNFQLPTVYDGVQNPLPYVEMNGPNHSYKTEIRADIASNGLTYKGDIRTSGNGVFSGNVGIGTNSITDYRLNVSGNIRANEIIVNTSGADFVFAPEYNLPDLAEVEKYIEENKHLPDVAPASEMQTDGMNVSEMQTKLLQKIEELTLYIIQQNKVNHSQEREIEILKQMIKTSKNYQP